MGSEKTVRVAYIILVLTILLELISMLLRLWGNAEYDICSIAGDTAGRVYVGKPGVIEVWEQGEMTGSIDPQTSRGYLFTVSPEDTILVAGSSTVYHLTLDGTLIESWEEPGLETYYQLQRDRYHHTSASRDEYVLTQALWWPRVVKNGVEEVYQLSAIAFVARIMTYIMIASFVILLPYIIINKIFEKIKYG